MPRKTGEGKKTKQSPYVNDDNPDLRKVVSALRIPVRDTVPGTRETLNAWGVPTFESKTPFCFYMVGKYQVTFGFHFGTVDVESEKPNAFSPEDKEVLEQCAQAARPLWS